MNKSIAIVILKAAFDLAVLRIIVQPDDGIPGLEQLAGQVAADKAGRSGDEYSPGGFSIHNGDSSGDCQIVGGWAEDEMFRDGFRQFQISTTLIRSGIVSSR